MQEPITTILIEPVDLSEQTVKECLELSIKLFDSVLVYTADFYGKESHDNDASMPWVDTYVNATWAISRNHIVSIEKSWVDNKEIWMLSISILGNHKDLNLFFKKESTCKQVYNQLLDYLWPNL